MSFASQQSMIANPMKGLTNTAQRRIGKKKRIVNRKLDKLSNNEDKQWIMRVWLSLLLVDVFASARVMLLIGQHPILQYFVTDNICNKFLMQRSCFRIRSIHSSWRKNDVPDLRRILNRRQLHSFCMLCKLSILLEYSCRTCCLHIVFIIERFIRKRSDFGKSDLLKLRILTKHWSRSLQMCCGCAVKNNHQLHDSFNQTVLKEEPLLTTTRWQSPDFCD